MATISSVGIGSGLDVNSIVSQLVAIEKTPLKTLALKATNTQNQISAFGEIQSQFAALTEVATRISNASAWTARTASSSNTSAATITATGTANATSFSLDVDQLAKKQSISSAPRPAGQFVGAGTLTIALGSWTVAGFTSAAVAAAKAADINAPIALNNYTIANDALTLANTNLDANPGVQSFIDAQSIASATAAKALLASDTAAALAAATDAADVTGLTAGATIRIDTIATDTVATLAAKINAAKAGVVATVFNDGTQDRLMLSSKDTGAAAGFRVQSATLTDFVFDPENNLGAGMAAASNNPVNGQDAKARINGLEVTSKTNTLTDNIPGVTINLLATTTVASQLSMAISEDVTPAVKNVTDFVTAYNTLNKSLADLTKYSAGTKTVGLFQGDSTITGLQNVLRNMVGSVSLGATSQRLSDMGIEKSKKLDGSLEINTAKLSITANNGTTLQQLFTTNNGNPLTNGFALKFRDLGKGIAATGGTLFNKSASLQKTLDRNAEAQTKVNDSAVLFETRLRKQYSTLDAQMARLTALNSYVSQQVTLWNKSTA